MPLPLLPIAALLALASLSLAPTAYAASADISNLPLGTVSTQKAKPNLMFVLDDSGSMARDYMPDDLDSISNYTSTYGFRSSQCNGVAYNPAIRYLPPIKADGTSYPAASFAAAREDGYNTGSTARNLGNSAYNYYYAYTGTETAMNWVYTAAGTADTTTNFYRQCMSYVGSSPGSSRFNKITLSSASTDAGNYANWFSYYRTRILTMRTAAGLAFQTLNSDFRVGFTRISDDTVTSVANGGGFLSASDFDTAQRTSFYSLLYSTGASGDTPLRGALAKVGRYYGNRISGQTDPNPNRYSCQRNYTLMSTDGYWNTGSEGGSYSPVKLDGSTLVGQQDGTEVRPMKDASSSSFTKTFTTTTTSTKTVSSTSHWQRERVSVGGLCNLLLGQWVTRQPQRCSPDQTSARTATSTLTTSSSYVESYVDGVLVSTSTPQAGPSSETTPVTVTPAAASCPSTAWTNFGTAPTTCEGNLLAVLSLLGLGSGGGTTAPDWVYDASTTTLSGATPTTPAPVVSPTTLNNGDSNTLADVAEYYYITDLRSDLADKVPSSGRDTNTKQHMTTFTLGLGVKGTLAYDYNYLTQTSGDYVSLTNGTKNWPTPLETTSGGDARNIDDLWHAAVNGRGQYFSATDPTSLGDAITTTINEINKATDTGAAAAASALSPVQGDDWLFLPSFTTLDWTGDLSAYKFTFDASGNLVAPVTAAASGGSTANVVWSAKTLLDARANGRSIYFNNGTSQLAAFNATNLTAAGLNTLFDVSCTTGATRRPTQCNTMTNATAIGKMTAANLIAYLTGNKTLYLNNADPANQVFRTRVSLLGDLINAAPVYVGAPPFNYADAGYAAYKAANASRAKTVYVAANDGMLHAFKVDTAVNGGGTELWAYVPKPIMSKLWLLADKGYSTNHQYYVDATPNVADIYDGTQWRTILVGGFGGGGRGYYALDVTDPAAPKPLWEISNATAGFENMGLSYGNPVITKNAAGTWVAVFTSGVNNVATGDGVGRLYEVNATTGALLRTLVTAAGDTTTPSNLSRINAWVTSDSNNTAQRFYGGDMLGNLWRFDLDDVVAPSGTEALLLGRALTPTNTPQPITSRPVMTELTVNGQKVPVVSFGTGRMLGLSDLTDTTRQTIYSVKDNLSATGLGTLRTTATSGLVQQNLGANRLVTSPRTVDWSSQNGWYVDLDQPATGTPRERVSLDGVPLSAGVIGFVSTEPIDDACSLGGQSYLYQFDLSSGQVAAVTLYESLVVGASRVVGQGNKVSAALTTLKGEIKLQAATGATSPSILNVRRSGWRELID